MGVYLHVRSSQTNGSLNLYFGENFETIEHLNHIETDRSFNSRSCSQFQQGGRHQPDDYLENQH
jgi:hypothetical protein